MKNNRKTKIYVFIALLSFVITTLLPSNTLSIEAASKVKLNKTNVIISMGDSVTLKLSGNKKPVTWKSLNKKIATVNKKGKVKPGWKTGTTKIQAKVGKKTYTCKVKVIDWYKLSKGTLELKIGKTHTLSLKGANGTVKWSSENKNVATVNSKGKITAKGGGSTNVIASYKGMKFYCSVYVDIDEVEAKKKILITYEQCDDCTVALVTNNNPYPVSIEAKMLFNDNSGVIGSASDDCYCVESGKTSALRFSHPDKERPASYKMTYTLSATSNKGYSSNIQTTTSNGKDGVVVIFTNTGDKYLEFIHATVLMYKDGELIGAETGYADCNDASSEDYRTFSYPYGNGGYIIPDSSKVIIDRAY